MSLIVKTITRLTVGLILIYGIYVVFEGHRGPGGGFAGGIIIALSFIHIMLAFGKGVVAEKLNEARGVALASLAACVLLVIAGLALVSHHELVQQHRVFALFGSSIILLAEFATAILVGAGFFVVFLVLVTVAGKKENNR